MSGTSVRESERLVLRRLALADAGFIVELLNEPGWLRFVGDRGVRTEADARGYLERGPLGLYERFGFGLYGVERKDDGALLGLCGLIKRDFLQDVDIGFALLARHEGHGYAYEAAAETVLHAREDLGMGRLAAITNPDNVRSIALLERLGMRFERLFRIPGEAADVRLYAMDLV